MFVAAEAFNAQGNSLGRIEVPKAPPPAQGQPPPQPTDNCPAA
jgi:hypothetical protein